MAGGKETPRQKMINLMYLVLLALLALQVSSAIIEKFQSLNTSLENANINAEKRSNELMQQIKVAVMNNKNNPQDVMLKEKAKTIRVETNKLVKYLRNTKEALIQKTGGRAEDGSLVGAKEEEKVAEMMLGPGESKNGEGYKLKSTLDSYVQHMNALMEDAKLNNTFNLLALDGKEDPIYKNHENHRLKSFAQLNFEGTPLVAALAVISEKESVIRAMEMQALSQINSKIGGEIIPVDKVRPVVLTKSNYVVAGTAYEADLFMAAYSSSYTPKMTFENNDIIVNETGTGKIKFRADAGNYNAQGVAKKTWKGTITYPKADGGDSTYAIEQEYFVRKPVIQATFDAAPIVYKECGNKLDIQVPALGAEYNPVFTANGGRVIPKSGGKIVFIPSKSSNKASIKIKNNGIDIPGKVDYQVKTLPAPSIKIKVGNRDVNANKGVTPNRARGLWIEIKATDEIIEKLPNDTKYRILEGEVVLAKGKTGKAPVSFNSSNMRQVLRQLATQSSDGQRIIIDLKKVQRKNYLNQWITVKNLEKRIFSVDILN